MPGSPSSLLGRDILSKVRASFFMNMEPSLSLPLIELNVNTGIWADGKSLSGAQNYILVVVKIKDPHLFLHKKQYPLKPDVQFSCSVMSNSLQPYESQHARPPCPSPTPGVYSNACLSGL